MAESDFSFRKITVGAMLKMNFGVEREQDGQFRDYCNKAVKKWC